MERSNLPMICKRCMNTRGGRTCRKAMCRFIPTPNPYKTEKVVNTEFGWVEKNGRYKFVRKDTIKSDKK